MNKFHFGAAPLFGILRAIDNYHIFLLCKDFNELSLADKTSSSSLSSSSSSTILEGYYPPTLMDKLFQCFLRGHSAWSRSINEQLQAPFIELPRNIIERHFPSSLLYDNNFFRMGLGFHFLPGQDSYLLKEFDLPDSFDRLHFLSNSLGLRYNSRAISEDLLYPYSHSGSGMRVLLPEENLTKILVEVITFSQGMYGRFLVYVCLGVGCTV